MNAVVERVAPARSRVPWAVAIVAILALPVYRGADRPALLEPAARATASAAETLLVAVSVPVRREGTVLHAATGFRLDVHPHCTGWLAIALLAAAALAGASRSRGGGRRGALLVAGAAGLWAANLLRLALLFAFARMRPERFDALHMASEVIFAATIAAVVVVVVRPPGRARIATRWRTRSTPTSSPATSRARRGGASRRRAGRRAGPSAPGGGSPAGRRRRRCG
jgi:exosortase/archaeosortase family protein